MSNRPIITRRPGAQPESLTPAPDAGDDDLAAFEEGGKLPAVDPVAAQVAELKAEVAKLKRRGNAEPSKPTVREPEMSIAQAQEHCAAQVAEGVRPRAILTPEGWYTHREMARVPGSVGNAATIKA